jgi:methyltransferase-like protein/ubiquinone/menaquinone biosynthesis C-methylase UbiE
MTPTPYDEVAYPGLPYPDTHPDHLATLGALFGMTPAPIRTCRVLELGCGDGANLIPIALELPASTCVGIDLSGRAIERAKTCARALGLRNVTFHHGDIGRLEPGLGRFDYLIAHGVYSWVLPEVRDRLLAGCGEHLAPQGVAFVSYNAQPGGHLREIVRGMMRFRARVVPAARQVEEGLAFARWIADSTPFDDLRKTLEPELEALGKREASVIFHDELSDAYAPVYFHEFVDHAARHGLQYLADADFSSMQSARFPSPLAETLHRIGDVLVKEQIQDFLRLRKFRQSLLCHADVALDRSLAAERLHAFWIASTAQPESRAEPDDSGETFRTSAGFSLSTNHPLAKAALHCLAEASPRRLAFEELAAMPALQAHAVAAEQGDGLEQILLTAFSGGFVELHVSPGAFTLEVSARPLASPLARWQLGQGLNVTTLRHAPITIEDTLLRSLILLLDGTRDHSTLLRDLTAAVAGGEARLERAGRVITDHADIAETLSRELPQALAGVARLPLLIA